MAKINVRVVKSHIDERGEGLNRIIFENLSLIVYLYKARGNINKTRTKPQNSTYFEIIPFLCHVLPNNNNNSSTAWNRRWQCQVLDMVDRLVCWLVGQVSVIITTIIISLECRCCPQRTLNVFSNLIQYRKRDLNTFTLQWEKHKKIENKLKKSYKKL